MPGDTVIGYNKGTPVGWSLDDRITLVDPVGLSEALVFHHKLDISRWRRKVNVITWPWGQSPGRVSLLMNRYDLKDFNLDEFHVLKIRYGDTVITFNNLIASAQPINLTPAGNKPDYRATYLVELSDLRHLLENRWFARPIDKGYNVLAADTGEPWEYYHDSLNAGVAWTWQAMLDNLWSQLNAPSELGGSPALPFVPEGEPQNFRFHGCSAWSAYNEVLRRLSCRFILWPAGETRIVQEGAEDANLVAALARYDNVNYRLGDEDPLRIIRGKVPRQVVVRFHKVYKHYGSEKTTEWTTGNQPTMDALYSVTVDCPDETTRARTQVGSQAELFSDRVAEVDFDLSILNEDDLQAVAEEMVDDYYRAVDTGGQRRHQIFNGFLDHTGFFPGSQVSATAWYDLGDGARTEVVNDAKEFRWDEELGGMSPVTEPDLADNLKGPDFARHTYPNYPDTSQLVYTTSSTPVGGLFPGVLVRVNPDTLEKEVVHQVLIHDPNQ